MPIYEYQCSACGKHFEEMQKISDPVLTVCPDCGKPTLKKLISQTQFQLKGGGWYATDYKTAKKPEDKAEKKPEKSSEKTTSSTETKTETKSNETKSKE